MTEKKIETPLEYKERLAEYLRGDSSIEVRDGMHLRIYTKALDFTISKDERYAAYILKKKYTAEQRGDDGLETASQCFCRILLKDFDTGYARRSEVSKDPSFILDSSHLLDWSLDLYEDTGIITPGLVGSKKSSKPFYSKDREMVSISEVLDDGKVKYKTADGLEHLLEFLK